jgi:hypothetical protein
MTIFLAGFSLLLLGLAVHYYTQRYSWQNSFENQLDYYIEQVVDFLIHHLVPTSPFIMKALAALVMMGTYACFSTLSFPVLPRMRI